MEYDPEEYGLIMWWRQTPFYRRPTLDRKKLRFRSLEMLVKVAVKICTLMLRSCGGARPASTNAWIRKSCFVGVMFFVFLFLFVCCKRRKKLALHKQKQNKNKTKRKR